MREEIRYFVAPGGDEPFTIEMCGTSYCDGSYQIHRKCAEVMVVEYVEQGTGMIQAGKQPVQAASAGDVYLLPRGEEHRYFSDAENPWVKHFFNIRGEIAEQLIYAYRLSGRNVFHCPQAQPLFLEFNQVAFGEGEREEIFSRCALLFHEIVSLLHRSAKDGDGIPAEARIVKECLDRSLFKIITIQELSDLIGRSPDYTIKLFRQYYHKTPYAYFLHQKMEAACAMLHNTTLTVQEIAFRLGYEDPHYFSNLFKQYRGISPKNFRERH